MPVKIRLRRMGAHKKPFYRIIVADSKSPRDGRFIEELGYYNPLTNPATVKIDALKARKWLSIGAQPTDTVRALFNKANISKLDKDEIISADASEMIHTDFEGMTIGDDELQSSADIYPDRPAEAGIFDEINGGSADNDLADANDSASIKEEPASETVK